MKSKKAPGGQKKALLIVAALLAAAIISASFLAREALGKNGWSKIPAISVNFTPLMKKIKKFAARQNDQPSRRAAPTNALFLSPPPATPSPAKIPIKKAKRRRLPANNRPVFPTPTPAPTVIPGQPGSKEWQEDFDRRWEEMNRYIEKKNREVRQAQEEFCRQNPNLCH